jgi:DNA-binding protein YbaB
MSEAYKSMPAALDRFAAVRGSGEAAGGLVRVELDGTGDLVDLVIEPKAMRLPSVDLAAAVRAAFGSARASVQESLAEAVSGEGAAPPDPSLARIGQDAERRLNELTSLAQELSSKLDRLG